MRTTLFFAAAILTLFAVGAIFFLSKAHRPTLIAAAIVARCVGADYRPTCYESEVPQLLNKGFSFEEAFSVAIAIQLLDRSAEYCHNIGHRLGATEVAKDPALWKEVARRAPLGKCLNGGMHGAFQERFKEESLTSEQLPAFVAEMKGFCNPHVDFPSSAIDLAMCAHGLGHLFVFVADGEVGEALPLCTAIEFESSPDVSSSSLEMSCYDGLFMQLFEPHEPEDHALIAGKEQTASTVEAFCNSFTGLAKSACMARSVSLFAKEYPGSFKGLDCAELDDVRQKNACRSTQLRLFARDTFLDVEAADVYCALEEPGRRGWCYAAAGSYAFMAGYDYDAPFAFCGHAGSDEVVGQCYRTLAEIIPFMFRTNQRERESLCRRLAEPYDEMCLRA